MNKSKQSSSTRIYQPILSPITPPNPLRTINHPDTPRPNKSRSTYFDLHTHTSTPLRVASATKMQLYN